MDTDRRAAGNFATRAAEFISQSRIADIPAAVQTIAKLHMIDGLATMAAGVDENASRTIRQYVTSLGSKGDSTVIGTGSKFKAQHAALVNGVQGHVLDYDDAQLTTLLSRPFGQQTHPTTPVLAAALALVESIDGSGAELLTAYIVGVEIACRLGDAVEPGHYLKGFHPTGTFGTFGAAAACARVLKLDTTGCAVALGIAGGLAAGLRANRGTMAKALNAGRAAENGVMAATLARQGFTASQNIFEDPMGYFSAACARRFDPELLFLAKPFFFAKPGVSIKLYPCAGVMHPVLDLLFSLVGRHNFRPEDVKRVRVTMPGASALPLVYKTPQTGLQGKFSLPFTVAVAVCERAAGIDQYTDQKVRDPKIVDIMERVDLFPSKQATGSETEVNIALQSGKSYRATVGDAHHRKPVTRSAVEAKFHQCAGGKLPPRHLKSVLDYISSIEDVKSLTPMMRLMKSPPG